MSKFVSNAASSPLRSARNSARDRRNAAIHESGHVVVAKHLGLWTMRAEIRKIEPQDDTEKEWVGSVACLMEGVVARKRLMVAVAGVVAESCWDRDVFEDLYGTLEFMPEEMSQSDWDLSGCPFGEPSKQFWNAMEHTFELLNPDTGKLWNALLMEARRLIVASRLDASLSMHPVRGEAKGFAP
jgi:hypothetical protein